MALRQSVSTDSAPEAIGPYSQGIRSGSLLFCSGQIPLDPSTGQVAKATETASAGPKPRTGRAYARFGAQANRARAVGIPGCRT